MERGDFNSLHVPVTLKRSAATETSLSSRGPSLISRGCLAMFSSEGATAATVGCEDELGMAGNKVQNDLWPTFGREDNASGPSRRQHNYGKRCLGESVSIWDNWTAVFHWGVGHWIWIDRQNEAGETEDEVQF